MTYEEANTATVSINSARAELKAHGFLSYILNGFLMATDNLGDAEPVAKVLNDQVKGSDVLGWLGY